MILSLPAPGAETPIMALVTCQSCVRLLPHRIPKFQHMTGQVILVTGDFSHEMARVIEHPAQDKVVKVRELTLGEGLAQYPVHSFVMSFVSVAP